MSPASGPGGHEAATEHRPPEGHPASGTDHSSNLLRQFKEIDLGNFQDKTDQFPTTRREAKEAATDLKATVKEVVDANLNAFEKIATEAKTEVKALEAQLDALEAAEKARTANENRGATPHTDSTILPNREELENKLAEANFRQDNAVQALKEAHVHATELLEKAKEFAQPLLDAAKWWRPLKSRDARMELMQRKFDHQLEQRDYQMGQVFGVLREHGQALREHGEILREHGEILQQLRTQVEEIRSRLPAGGDTPPPDPPRGDRSDESRPVAPPSSRRSIDNPTGDLPLGDANDTPISSYDEHRDRMDAVREGMSLREMYNRTDGIYTRLRENPHNIVERERFEIIQSALTDVEGDTAFARMNHLADNLNDPNNLQRWVDIRAALRSTPAEVHRLYSQIEEGVVTRDYHLLEAGRDDARLGLANRALEGLGENPDEQLRELFARYRDLSTSDADWQDAQERLTQLNLALHASPDAVERLRTPMSADELKNGLPRLNDDDREKVERVLDGVPGDTLEEKIDTLEAQRQRGGADSMKAYRTMLIVQAIQQGLGAVIQTISSPDLPQS